ncbi:MAG: hypothetical protein R6V13_07910, partial [Anaerolineae bacterium]
MRQRVARGAGVRLRFDLCEGFTNNRNLFAGFVIDRGLDLGGGVHGLGHVVFSFSNVTYASGGVSGIWGKAHLEETSFEVLHFVAGFRPRRFHRLETDGKSF